MNSLSKRIETDCSFFYMILATLLYLIYNTHLVQVDKDLFGIIIYKQIIGFMSKIPLR